MAKQLPTLDISSEVLNEVFIPFISRKEETCKQLIVYEGGRASGKALDISTPIPTPYGWKTMGEINVGDEIFGSDGSVVRVVAISPVMYNHSCYRVKFNDGNEIIADEEHLWKTETHSFRKAIACRKHFNHIQHIVKQTIVTTREILNTSTQGKRKDLNHSIVSCSPLSLSVKTLLVDPYVLGTWLGDGTSKSSGITSADPEIIYEIQRRNYVVEKSEKSKNWTIGKARYYRIDVPQKAQEFLGLKKGRCKKTLTGCYKVLDVFDNKHIPIEYLRASEEQRLDLLKGLMDTDGHIGNGNSCNYYSTNARLANDVEELVISLGFIARHTTKTAMLYGKNCGISHTITFRPDKYVFCLPRKRDKQNFTLKQESRSRRRMIVSVVPVQSVPVKCIKVDSSDSLFLAGKGLIATHNSDAIAQFLITLSYSTKKRILLMRKVEKSIRNSSYRLIQDYVNKWKLRDFFNFVSSMLTIKVLNGSEFICMGFDEAEKIKSIANIDVVWIEEATEISLEDFETLLFTIRGKGIKRIILSFNRKLGNWTEEYFFYANGQFKEREDVYHLHTTFQNNKFLSVADIQRFERLKIEDPRKYDKIALGLPVKLEGLVYEKWDVFKEEFPLCREELYGLDFGFTDPKALIRCGRIGKDLYLDEVLYERNLIREDFIKLLPQLIPDRGAEIWADSEDPESIQVIYNSGWNIHAVEKTKGSVLFGVEALSAFNIHITERSTNVIKDFENYKWKQRRDGQPIEKEEPAHSFSHAPRATEYAVRSRWAELNPILTLENTRDVEIEEMESVSIAERW